MGVLLAPQLLFNSDPAPAPAELNFEQQVVDTGNKSSYTFSSQPIGSVATDRKVIVVVLGRGGGVVGPNSVTVGGESMTEAWATSGREGAISDNRSCTSCLARRISTSRL